MTDSAVASLASLLIPHTWKRLEGYLNFVLTNVYNWEKEPKYKRSFITVQFILDKHHIYQRLNNFWKFGCDRFNNMEVT